MRSSKSGSLIDLSLCLRLDMVIHDDMDKSAARLDGPRALHPDEYSSALKLINSVLRPNIPGMILKEYPLVLGTENIENMRVIVKEKEVLSHAAIYFSKLRTGELAFKVGGIGSVATHPEWRGQGLASAVIRDCIRIMEESKCHLSVLWTQRHSFYRRLGYETAGSEYLIRVKASDFARIPSECKVVPYSFEHLPAVIEIHERQSLRTERTTKEYEAYLEIPKTQTFLAMRGRTVTAYAVMGKGEDFRSCVHEWGGDARDVLCLIRSLVHSSRMGEILILVPSQDTELTQIFRQMQLTKTFEYLAMMRVIDVKSLSLLLHDFLSPRLGKDFRIVRNQAGTSIKVGKEEAEIDREQKLVRVLFGPDSPASWLPGFSQETLHALDSVLPIPLFIWGLDSV